MNHPQTNGCADQPAAGCCLQQQIGRTHLHELIIRHRRYADELETLSAMLPAQPTPEQDQAIFAIALNLADRR